MVIELSSRSPEPRKIQLAVNALRAGKVIAYPTDTCYGLGCDLFNKKAIDELCRIKGVKRNKPFSFLCEDIASIAKYAMLHNTEFRILKEFLPGPYCFVLKATRDVPRLVQSKRKNIGIRVPNHAISQALLSAFGSPIISTSAARTGELPHVDPREIERDFPGLALVLDGGEIGCTPSSVIDLTGPSPEVLREGAGDVAPFEN